jgi:hypothetical protein
MTISAREVLDYWRARIEQDLAPFADPGTTLEVLASGRTVTVRWEMRAEPKEALVSLTAGLDSVQVTFGGRPYSYASFLASEGMADLRTTARMILQSAGAAPYVQTKARVVGPGGRGEPATAVSLMQQTLAAPSGSATRILFVTADAGAGKTAVLRELVKNQALAYQQGQTSCLYLYVNAQGRALARFHEALATELNELRSTIPHHAVATLVRAGIVVPIIDGFDELLGVGGYDDAFASLSAFIEELDGNGQLVASARSAYYEDEFIARATSSSLLGSQAWEVTAVAVAPWGTTERGEFVALAVPEGDRAETSGRLEAAVVRNEALLRKPFFVAKTVDLLKKGIELGEGADLLAQLVTAYLDRERTEKLLDANHNPLLTTAQVRGLLAAVAEDMWRLETRELDRRSIRETATLVAEVEGLTEQARNTVVEKMPYFAILSVGQTQGRISFEHEMFFGYFLSSVFEEALKSGGPVLGSLLSRGSLPGEVAERVAQSVQVEALQGTLTRLSRSVDASRSTRARENAGELARNMLVECFGAGQALPALVIEGMTFAGGSFGGLALTGAQFKEVTFQRCDLSDAQFRGCFADGTVLLEVIVNPAKTRLELRGVNPDTQVTGMQVWIDDQRETVFDPRRVREFLVSCGTVEEAALEPEIRAVSPAAVEIVDLLARAYRRANPVCIEDPKLLNAGDRREWPDIRKAMLASGVITPDRPRQTRGPRKEFLRRQVLPEQLMAGINRRSDVPQSVRTFWDEMERVFPAR